MAKIYSEGFDFHSLEHLDVFEEFKKGMVPGATHLPIRKLGVYTIGEDPDNPGQLKVEEVISGKPSKAE
jgi:hypothetical protein